MDTERERADLEIDWDVAHGGESTAAWRSDGGRWSSGSAGSRGLVLDHRSGGEQTVCVRNHLHDLHTVSGRSLATQHTHLLLATLLGGLILVDFGSAALALLLTAHTQTA